MRGQTEKKDYSAFIGGQLGLFPENERNNNIKILR
jgi:hypothetical protein